MIASGIVIAEPWISLILDGRKRWEMRTRPTMVRGPIALIRKGSGTVVGTAEVVDCLGPLDRRQMKDTIDNHAISAELIESGRVDNWNHAWVLSNIQSLITPVPYSHPKGAVVWIRLAPQVSEKIQTLLGTTEGLNVASEPRLPGRAALEAVPRRQTLKHDAALNRIDFQADSRANSYPIAKDGAVFGRHLGVRGYFQIGAKGEEQKYRKFEDALAELRKMRVARWRRPNKNGNWGIVSAVEWIEQD